MLAPLVISAFVSMAASQVTLTAPNIGYDDEAITLAGSIVSVSPDATTVALGCGSQSDCGLFPAHTLVYGASTYNIDMSDPNTDFTATVDCVVAPSSATCKETAGGSEANFPGSSTEEYSDIGTFLIQITAGSEKLTEPASAKATPTISSAMASGMSISGMQTLSAASGVSASATSSGAAQASTAAAAGNAATIGGGLLGVAAGVFGGLLL